MIGGLILVFLLLVGVVFLFVAATFIFDVGTKEGAKSCDRCKDCLTCNSKNKKGKQYPFDEIIETRIDSIILGGDPGESRKLNNQPFRQYEFLDFSKNKENKEKDMK